MKKIYVIILLMLLSLGNINVKAKSNEKENTDYETATDSDANVYEEQSLESEVFSDKIIKVSLVYTDKNGTEHILKQTNGFFIGDNNSGLYVVSLYNKTCLSEEETNYFSEVYGGDNEKIKTSIKLGVSPDVLIDATIETYSEGMDVVILKPEKNPGNVTPLKLSVTKDLKGDEVFLYYLDKNNKEQFKTTEIKDWISVNGMHYYCIDMNLSDEFISCPVVNKRGDVVGISLKSLENTNYVVHCEDIMELCKLSGIEYNGNTDIDISELEKTIYEFEKLNLKKYSSSSVSMARTTYREAVTIYQSILLNEYNVYSQNDVYEVTKSLNDKINGLEKQSRLKTVVIILAISIAAFFLILIFMVFIIIGKRKKVKILLSQNRDSIIQAKEALKISGRITPGEKKILLSANMPINRSLSTVTCDTSNNTDTTVLNNDTLTFTSENIIRSNAFILRKRTGEEVLINKNTFVIGTDAENVDYHITYNTNISKKHVIIQNINGNFFIEDMGTTNGTFVNGFEVKNQRIMLQNGAIIVLADEEFEFRK